VTRNLKILVAQFVEKVAQIVLKSRQISQANININIKDLESSMFKYKHLN